MAVPDRIGRYRVVRLVGTGATSSVFLAHDEGLDAPVAVKVLADNLARNEAVVQAFLAEARLLRRLQHPNVVPVHDLGTLEGGQPYLVMDLVEGGTLAEAAERRGAPYRREDLLAIAGQLAAAVGALHAAGIVHGDLKPENVLLAPGGRLVVTDFGLATGGAGTGGAGTPGYAPPEQLDGQGTGPAADLYALTSVVARLATGTAPPAAPGAVPGAPDWVAAFVAHGRAADPADRPADAASWLAELHGARSGRTGARRGLAAAGLLVAAGAVGFAVVAAGGDDQAEGDLVLAADTATGRLFAVDPGDGSLEVVLGDAPDGITALSGAGGPAPGDGPWLITVGNQVLRLAGDGTTEAVAGTGTAGDRGDNGAATAADLNRPAGVALLGDDVVVADTANGRLRRVDADDGTIRPLGAALSAPRGLTADAGDVLAADTARDQVHRIAPDGTTSLVAGSGVEGAAGDGGPASEADLRDPSDVAVVPAGTVIADTGNGRLRLVGRDGTISTLADGFDRPHHLAATATGGVVVADDRGLWLVDGGTPTLLAEGSFVV